MLVIEINFTIILHRMILLDVEEVGSNELPYDKKEKKLLLLEI